MPAAGEKVRRGWRVRVAESMGPQREIIPAVIGNSERAAELNIRRRGLDLLGVSQFRANPQVLVIYLHTHASQLRPFKSDKT